MFKMPFQKITFKNGDCIYETCSFIVSEGTERTKYKLLVNPPPTNNHY